MSDQPDPKEIKLLADILALVLEPGQSTTALDAVRRRAQASRVTGGAIKNLFLRLASGQIEAGAERGAERAQAAVDQLHRELDVAKRDIAALQGERHRLQLLLAASEAEQRDAVAQQHGSLRVGLACGAFAMLALVLVVVGVQALRAIGQPQSQPTEIAAVAPPVPPPQPAPPSPAPPTAPQSAAAAPTPPDQPPARMSDAARQAIGEHVRSCWVESGGVARPATASFDIQVQVDGGGTIRAARLTGEDQAARQDPDFRIFADRALHALTDPRCATLPLPLAMLGRPQTLEFHFAP